MDFESCKLEFLKSKPEHGYQNLDIDPTILRTTYLKQFGSFKDLCDYSGSIGSYDFDDCKWPWFFVIFFNSIEGLVGPKWKIKS